MSAKMLSVIHTPGIKQSAKPSEAFPDAASVRVPTKSPTVSTYNGAESS